MGGKTRPAYMFSGLPPIADIRFIQLASIRLWLRVNESADQWRAAEVRRQDARFRGAMLDALERGRERLASSRDYRDDDREREPV
jgi:hypothetical protein